MLKLSTIGTAETAVLHLQTASDSPLLTDTGATVTVTVYGPGSRPYQQAKATQQNRLMSRLQRKGAIEETPESKALNEAEFLAMVTAGDSGLDIEGLTEGLAGVEKYRAIYSCAALGFIGEQVAKFCGDWSNFSMGSAKS